MIARVGGPSNLLLCIALAGAGIAACTPATPPPTAPPEPAPMHHPVALPTPIAPAPTASAEPAPTASAEPAPAPKSFDFTGFTLVKKSTMLDDVVAAGHDLKALKPFAKMTYKEKRELMEPFQKALGYESCSGCHLKKSDGSIDYLADTEHSKIAKNMWDDFVVGLRHKDGTALFCDSCHQGKEDVLGHSSHETQAAFMEAEYVDKLVRVNGEKNGCSTCHGDPFNEHFLGRNGHGAKGKHMWRW